MDTSTYHLPPELHHITPLVNTMLDPVIITDPEGICLYVNEAFETVTGYTPEDVLGKKAGSTDIWGGTMDKEFYQKLWQTVTKDKKTFRDKIRNKRKNGEEYNARISITPLLDEHNNITHIISTEHDLSEQDLAQEQIASILNQASERGQEIAMEKARIESLLESIGEGIIATDQDGRITRLNKSAQDMLGWTEEEVKGKPVIEVLKLVDEKDNDIPVSKRPMVLSLSTGQKTTLPPSVTYFFVRKDGTKFAAGITVAPYVISNRIIGTIEIFHDITVEKDIDKAKTEFVSLASHQLRTPLSAINWYSEMLIAGDAGDMNDEQKEYVQMIYDSNQRSVKLVDALLNVSRIDLGTFTIEPEIVDITKIVHDMLDELQPKIIEKKVKIEKHFDPEQISMSADPRLITIIFQNLLSNGVKYNKDEGTLKIRLEKQKEHYFIQVADTGLGIPQKDHAKIFSKLFRADNVKVSSVEGNGLGLYIVKAIVDQCHGTLTFESEEHVGTTFTITLPLSGMPRKTK